MKPLDNESKTMGQDEDCAGLVMETVLLVMRAIRSEMGRKRPADLSVPQFRTLAYLRRHPGTSLSDVAEHIGLTLPSISKMVDGLVKRELIARESSPDDRRKITLTLTDKGWTAFEAIGREARSHLAAMLAPLSARDREQVVHAMGVLRSIFLPERGAE